MQYIHSLLLVHCVSENKKAVLSQGEVRDAAVNFDVSNFTTPSRAVSTAFRCTLSTDCSELLSVKKNKLDCIFNAHRYVVSP